MGAETCALVQILTYVLTRASCCFNLGIWHEVARLEFDDGIPLGRSKATTSHIS